MREEPWARIAHRMIESHATAHGVDRGEILATIEEPARTRLASRLNDDPTFADEGKRAEVLNDCLERLSAAGQVESRRAMLAELRRLEESGDETGAAALLAAWNARRNIEQ
jgi:hypothetical protein